TGAVQLQGGGAAGVLGEGAGEHGAACRLRLRPGGEPRLRLGGAGGGTGGRTMSEQAIPLTVTHMLEHQYCPRFTYFEYVLGIAEGQGGRDLVQRGRRAHEERRRINPGYLRKKLGVVGRQFDVPLASSALGVRGAVDEVLTLADGTMAPFDYKYAEYRGKVYRNQRVQSALYGLLIAEVVGAEVRRGLLCDVG